MSDGFCGACKHQYDEVIGSVQTATANMQPIFYRIQRLL